MAAKYPDDEQSLSSERFLDVNKEPQIALGPLENYEKKPLVTLDEAVKPIENLIPNIKSYAWAAKENCKNSNGGITKDEAAAIHLYTMQCLYCPLNAALRSEKRKNLIPYYSYLKLMLTALWKLPSKKCLVYRGVKDDISTKFNKGMTFTWWGFTSCTSALNVLQSETFLGISGKRTLFNIECIDGKIIQNYSHYDENEVLLVPCSHFEVLSKIDQGNGLHTIHIKQIQPPVSLIQPPFPPVETEATVLRRDSSTSTDPDNTWNENGSMRNETVINKSNLDKVDGYSEENFVLKSSYDGLRLVGRYWPVSGMNKPCAAVLFVHGSGEHCQRYRHVAHFFNKHQIPCIAYDSRGNGLSGGDRGFIPSTKAWLDDLQCVIKYIREKLCFTMPLVIYAHGTGCVNCLAYILQRPESRLDCESLILSTPSICLKDRPSLFQYVAAQVITNVIPNLKVGIRGNYTNEYCNDKDIVEAYRNDPLTHDVWPIKTISILLKIGKSLETNLVKFQVPVMIQHGAEDKITPIELIQKWVQDRVKGVDVTFKSWPGHNHEIHNDIGREDIFKHALEWIEKRFKTTQN